MFFFFNLVGGDDGVRAKQKEPLEFISAPSPAPVDTQEINGSRQDNRGRGGRGGGLVGGCFFFFFSHSVDEVLDKLSRVAYSALADD